MRNEEIASDLLKKLIEIDISMNYCREEYREAIKLICEALEAKDREKTELQLLAKEYSDSSIKIQKEYIELEAERDALKAELESAREVADMHCADAVRLERENAELSEHLQHERREHEETVREKAAVEAELKQLQADGPWVREGNLNSMRLLKDIAQAQLA